MAVNNKRTDIKSRNNAPNKSRVTSNMKPNAVDRMSKSEQQVCPSCNEELERDCEAVQEMFDDLNFFEQVIVFGAMLSEPRCKRGRGRLR